MTPSLSTAQKKFGATSLYVPDPGEEYMTRPGLKVDGTNHAEYDFGSGNFTLECWVRPDSGGSGYQGLFCLTALGGGGFSRTSFFWAINPDGGMEFVATAGSSWDVNINTSGHDDLRDNAWHHVAVVRNGTSWKVYVDGTERGSATSSITINAANGRELYVGRHPEAVSLFGYMDEGRISKGVARYTSNFTPSSVPFQTDANASLLMHFDGANTATTTIDSSACEAYSEGTIIQEGTYALKGVAAATKALNKTLTRTVSPTVDLTDEDTLTFWARASRTGTNLSLSIRDSGSTVTTKNIAITDADTWEQVEWDISGVSNANKDAINRIQVTVTNADALNTFYLDALATAAPGAEELSGAMEAALTGSGTLTRLRALAGGVLAALTGSGTLTHGVPGEELSGAMEGTLTGVGTLTRLRALSGAMLAALTGLGNLLAEKELAPPGELGLTVALREVAEYEGEGLLTCLAQYDGAVFVGCELGEAGLLALEDGEFVAVDLPLESAEEDAWAAVQALVVWEEALWAFGWESEAVLGGGSVDYVPGRSIPDSEAAVVDVVPVVWSYDGLAWARYAQGEARSMLWRWAEPVVLDGALWAGLFHVTEGTGLTVRVENDGFTQVDALPMRAGAPVGDRPLRLLLTGEAAGACRLEGAAGFAPFVAYTDPDWGDCWHPLQPMVAWQARAWVSAVSGDWQRLYSSRGGAVTGGPSWRTEALGAYEVFTVWRNRLLMFGQQEGADVFGLWEPPRLRLGLPTGLDWRVRFARPFGGDLWALGTQGSVSGEDLRQAVLRAGGGVRVDWLTVEWGDGLGANQPTVASARLEWARTYPTRVAVAGLTAEWSDGAGGQEARPKVGSLTLQYGDNHALNQPTLARACVEWHKGEDHRPSVTSLELQFGDGLAVNQPTVSSARLEWRSPTGGLKRPRVLSLTVEHGDGAGANQPTVTAATVQWGDGLGIYQPSVVSGEVQWSIGYARGRPAVASLGAEWGDHGPWPPPQGVWVADLTLEWNDDASPVAQGQEVLWLTTMADAPLLGLRLSANISLPVGRTVLCLVRCDREGEAVDAWHTYQRFALNRTVLVEEPGTEVRIGVVKPAAVAPFDVFAQMLLDE